MAHDDLARLAFGMIRIVMNARKRIHENSERFLEPDTEEGHVRSIRLLASHLIPGWVSVESPNGPLFESRDSPPSENLATLLFTQRTALSLAQLLEHIVEATGTKDHQGSCGNRS